MNELNGEIKNIRIKVQVSGEHQQMMEIMNLGDKEI